MGRISIQLKQEGPIIAIKMTSRFFGIPLFRVYAFFVDGLLIDTGFVHGRDRFLKLCDTLRPAIVVNTHHHEDHTGNNFWMREKYGLLPLAHPKTFSYLQDPSQWIPWYRRLVWGCPHPSETGELDSKIQTQRFRFLVIPTPGHSDDHICLYEPNEAWLFSGDLFISEQVKYLREDEDIYSIIDSLKKVAALHPKKMFCSFSGIVDRAKETIQHKIEHLENLKNEVKKGLQRGLSTREIRRRLLGRGDQFSFLSSGHISKQNLINAFFKPKRG
jgi:glyoxylase-like metal-dependent hydrolase (beta-lactamase superfamily II)